MSPAPYRSLISDGISEYDAAITKAFDAHPDAGVFASFPVAGATFAPRLLAAFGADRERFASARAIQEYAGVAPVTEANGQSHWVHRRFACPRFVRQSIVEWAGMSIRGLKGPGSINFSPPATI